MTRFIEIPGQVVIGTQAASGTKYFSEHGGTIALQRTHFEQAGVDLTRIHNGTVNVDIKPLSFYIKKPTIIVPNVYWHPIYRDRSETFWFVECILHFQDNEYEGFVYYPHPSTKIGISPGKSVIETLIPFISNLNYGSLVALKLPDDRIEIERQNESII
jgi:hypothetical protein